MKLRLLIASLLLALGIGHSACASGTPIDSFRDQWNAALRASNSQIVTIAALGDSTSVCSQQNPQCLYGPQLHEYLWPLLLAQYMTRTGYSQYSTGIIPYSDLSITGGPNYGYTLTSGTCSQNALTTTTLAVVGPYQSGYGQQLPGAGVTNCASGAVITENNVLGSCTSCTIAGNLMTLGGTVTGTFTINGFLLPTQNVPAGTQILALKSGTANTSGAVYVLSTYTTVSTGQTMTAYSGYLWSKVIVYGGAVNASNGITVAANGLTLGTANTATIPTCTSNTISGNQMTLGGTCSGTWAIGDGVWTSGGTAVTAGSEIVKLVSGTASTPGAVYQLAQSSTVSTGEVMSATVPTATTFTAAGSNTNGAIASGVLTLFGTQAGGCGIGSTVTGTGVTANSVITGYSGTAAGVNGPFTLSQNSSVSGITITCSGGLVPEPITLTVGSSGALFYGLEDVVTNNSYGFRIDNVGVGAGTTQWFGQSTASLAFENFAPGSIGLVIVNTGLNDAAMVQYAGSTVTTALALQWMTTEGQWAQSKNASLIYWGEVPYGGGGQVYTTIQSNEQALSSQLGAGWMNQQDVIGYNSNVDYANGLQTSDLTHMTAAGQILITCQAAAFFLDGRNNNGCITSFYSPYISPGIGQEVTGDNAFLDPLTGFFWNQASDPTIESADANATTTFANVTDGTRTISLNVNPGQRMNVVCAGAYQASATSVGIQFQWTGPAVTYFTSDMNWWTGASSSNDSVITALATAQPATAVVASVATTNYKVQIAASILASGSTPATTTPIVLQFKASAAGSVTIEPGFNCKVQ